MKVSHFFKEKYFNYQLVIQAEYEDEDNEYYYLDFFIKDNKINYPGFATKEDREFINYIIGGPGLLTVLDHEIDKETEQIFIEIRR